MDGTPLDAMMDAQPDARLDAGPPPTPMCASTASVLADIAPSRVREIGRADDTLYVLAYDHDDTTGDSNRRVLTYDLNTGMPVGTPIPFSSMPRLWPGNGEVWVTESAAGSIWRLRPDASPEEVVSGRPYPGAVVAEGGYVYWSESIAPNSLQLVVKRRLIAGGDVEPVMDCLRAEFLYVIGDNIYCAHSLDIHRAPKTGGTAVLVGSLPYYPIDLMARDGDDLFPATGTYGLEIFHVPTPSGPAELVMDVMNMALYTGIAATPESIFLISQIGVQRIDRATNALENRYVSVACAGDPVIWNNKLVFMKLDSRVVWCVDDSL